MIELIKDAIKSRSWHIENLIEAEADAQVIAVAEAIAIVDRYTETPKPASEWVSVEFKNIKACSSYYVRDGRGDWFLVYVNKDGEYETGATSCPIEYLNVEGVEILALPQPPKDID